MEGGGCCRWNVYVGEMEELGGKRSLSRLVRHEQKGEVAVNASEHLRVNVSEESRIK